MSDTLTLSPRTRGRSLAVILAAGLALAAGGCDREDSAATALATAESKLRAMIPGREQVPGQQMVNTYNEVLTTLQPVVQAGTRSQKAAASSIVAQAHAGLAEGSVVAAQEVESQTHNAILELRALHTRFLTLAAMAEAGQAFDPTAENAELDQRDRQLDHELTALQQSKAQIDSQIATLNAQAKALADQAKAKRQESSTIKGTIVNETATRGQELMVRARELGREADALEVEQATLEAQARKLEPDSAQAQLDIDRVHQQKQLLVDARADVQKRVEASRSQAATARAEAEKVAAAIRERVSGISQRRAEDQARAAEEAAGEYQKAIDAAQQATSGGSTGPAQMALGSYHQLLGDLCWSRAQGADAWATMLEALATGKPALPNATQYENEAAQNKTFAKEMLQKATESYKAADEAYRSAGGDAEIQQRIDRINELLARNVKVTSGGAEDIRVQAAAPEPAPEAEGAAPAPSAEGGSPNDALRALQTALDAGDTSALDRYILTTSEEQKQVVQATASIMPAKQRLQKALEAKFGDEGKQAMQAMNQQGGIGGMGDWDPSNLEFQINGDTATATGPNGQPLVMKQVDGAWKLDLSALQMDPAQLQAAIAMAPNIAKAMDEVAADVEAGKYASVQEAIMAIAQKLQAAGPQR